MFCNESKRDSYIEFISKTGFSSRCSQMYWTKELKTVKETSQKLLEESRFATKAIEMFCANFVKLHLKSPFSTAN